MFGTDQHEDWTRRIICADKIGVSLPPAWLVDSYTQFRVNVTNPLYPCYFGSQAVLRDAIFYSYVDNDDTEDIAATLLTFLHVCGNIRMEKNNLVIFFRPGDDDKDHARSRTRFWNVLCRLSAADPAAGLAKPVDPSDPSWEFSFGGNLFFVLGASPSFLRRRSRNLGPGLVMIFQPRQVFQDYAEGGEIDLASRLRIRCRAEAWDGIGPHPDLGIFGESGNREWIQYFISDDEVREVGRCPLSTPSPDRT